MAHLVVSMLSPLATWTERVLWWCGGCRCSVALKEEAGNHIMGAIGFEERKVRAIVFILRNVSRGPQLSEVMEKGEAEDGKVDR
jgi:hypothetical protein